MPKVLTREEYRDAIYLDFEGEGKKGDGSVPMPHMAGTFKPNLTGKSGSHSYVFFSETWKPVCSHFYKKAVIADFTEYFDTLSSELAITGQYIVFWSMHESMILEKYLPKKLFEQLVPRLHNLHPIAKTYTTRKRAFGAGNSARGKSLEAFLSALYDRRHPYPPFPLGAAEACRRIDQACLNHKRWKNFSVKQKSYADDLIQYNSGDCKSTWLIAKRIGNFYNQANGVLK